VITGGTGEAVPGKREFEVNPGKRFAVGDKTGGTWGKKVSVSHLGGQGGIKNAVQQDRTFWQEEGKMTGETYSPSSGGVTQRRRGNPKKDEGLTVFRLRTKMARARSRTSGSS